jgi:hypothetical protein
MLKKYSIFREVNNILSNDEYKGIYNLKIKEYLNSNNNLEYHNLNELNNLKYKDKGFFILSNNNNCLNDGNLISTAIDCHTLASKKFINSFNFYSPIPKDDFLNRMKCIQYERNNNDEEILDFDNLKNIIIEKINNKENICIFPEKTTMSNKNSLLSFRSDYFSISYQNNIPILPIIIKYNNEKYFSKNNEIDRSIINISDTMGINIYLLDFIYPSNYKTIDELYNYTYNTMNNFYKN